MEENWLKKYTVGKRGCSSTGKQLRELAVMRISLGGIAQDFLLTYHLLSFYHDTGRGKSKYCEKNLSKCHCFAPQISYDPKTDNAYHVGSRGIMTDIL